MLMMWSRLAITGLLLLPVAARAQQLNQQVDAAVAQISRAAVGMSNQIAMDQQQIAQLQAELAARTKERDEAKQQLDEVLKSTGPKP